MTCTLGSVSWVQTGVIVTSVPTSLGSKGRGREGGREGGLKCTVYMYMHCIRTYYVYTCTDLLIEVLCLDARTSAL